MDSGPNQMISAEKRSELLSIALDCLGAVAADPQAPRNARLQAARSLLEALREAGQGVRQSQAAAPVLEAPASPAQLADRLAEVRKRRAAVQATAGLKPG